MQPSKPRSESSVPKRTSPAATPRSNGSPAAPQRSSPGTPKSTHARKTSGSESEPATSKSAATKTLIDRSPKLNERRSPRSPITESRRPSRVTELECKLVQLQEDLKKTKDELGTSESGRRLIQQEAEEAKKQLSAMTAKLEDTQLQLMGFSVAEEARLEELREISKDRDDTWQSELEAAQKQHAIDSGALATAMSEVCRLKQQLEMIVKPETVQSELMTLKQEIEELKAQLRNSEQAEVEARAMVHGSQQQLEMAMTTVEASRTDGSKAMEFFGSKTSELEESRTLVASLEETMKKLQATRHTIDHEDSNKEPGDFMESEVEHLRSTLEAAEVKYHEEQIKSTMQIQSAYESAERVRISSGMMEAELESALKNANAEIIELQSSLTDKETELKSISEMNTELTAQIADLKASHMDKETELQGVLEENEELKAKTGKNEMEAHRSLEAAITEVELARAAEKDALMRLGRVAEEAEKSSGRVAKVAEKLETAQAANSEMEAELRRLRVQSDQWRKAAEAAAAALTPAGNNGRFVERACSLNAEYESVAGKWMGSPLSDDELDDESAKKKKNVMRRISGLWRKSPK